MKVGLLYTALVLSLSLVSQTSLSQQRILFEKGMEDSAKIYLSMQKELAKDSFKSFAKLSIQLEKLAKRFDMSQIKGEHSKHYSGIPKKIISQSKILAKARDIKEVRKSFKVLSQAFAMWVSMNKTKSLQIIYCPMAQASWIQKAGTEIANPYLTNMPRCGNVIGESKGKKKHHH